MSSPNEALIGFSWDQDMVPGHLTLLRELLTYDVQWDNSVPLDIGEFGPTLLEPQCMHWSRRFEWPWLLYHSELSKDHTVLDVGGTSTLTFPIALRCGHLTRLDINQEFLNKAWSYFPQLGLTDRVTDVVGDARQLPFPDNHFDRVFCVSVIEHIEDSRERAFTEMIRVLKPGGLLLVTMDILIKGKEEGNFFVGPQELIALCEKFNFPVPKKVGIGGQLPNGVMLNIYLMKWQKP